jgi:hypothetical protein
MQKQRHKPYSCSLCCSCSLPPLALRRSLAHGRHTGKGGIGCGGMGIVIGIGTTCFGDIGRSGFAVGYLPATATASGLAKKPARLPYSSPNAKKHKQELHTQTCWLQALFNLDETAQATSTGKTAHGIYAADSRSPNCRGATVMLAVQHGRFSRIHRSLPKTVVTDELPPLTAPGVARTMCSCVAALSQRSIKFDKSKKMRMARQPCRMPRS